MRLTKPQVFAGAVLVSWACAKQNPPDPGSYTPSETGGSSTHLGTGGSTVQSGSGGSSITTGGSATASGGSSESTGAASGTGGDGSGGNGSGGMHAPAGTGGSTASAGRTGTGGTNARAGGPGTGAGGTNGLGGISSVGGSAGTSPVTGTTGGSMGAAGVPNDPNWKPPDMTATAQLVVMYQANQTAAMATNIQFTVSLMNQTDAAYDLSNVTMRYWFSSEPPPVFSIYYQAPTLNLGKTLQFVPNMADSYILFTFGKGGTVEPYVDQNSLNDSKLQVGAQAGVNNTHFDQSNDWSYDGTTTALKANPKITLYDGDTLIWGCEPSHVCAAPPAMTGGEAGGGGAGGAP